MADKKIRYKFTQTGAQNVSGSTQKIDGALKGAAKSALKFAGAYFGAQGVISAMKGAVSVAKNLEKGFAEVGTLANLSKDQIASLKDGVIELSKRVPESAENLTKALYETVSAGVAVGDSLKFIETASRAGIAGVSDTKTAVDAMTTVINAYGLSAEEAERVSDTLFTTVKRGKLHFDDIATSLGMVIPVASSFGVSFNEVAASYATLTKNGMLATRVSTSLGAAITEMVTPGMKAAEAIKDLGYESGEAALESKTLQEIAAELYDAGYNLSEIFGREAARAILILGKNSQTASADLLGMESAAGSTEEAYERMADTFSAESQILKNNITAIGDAIGGWLIPKLSSLSTGVVGFIGKVDNAKDAFGEWNTSILTLARGYVGLQEEIKETANVSVQAEVVEQLKEQLATLELQKKAAQEFKDEMDSSWAGFFAALLGVDDSIKGIVDAGVDLANISIEELVSEIEIFKKNAKEIGESTEETESDTNKIVSDIEKWNSGIVSLIPGMETLENITKKIEHEAGGVKKLYFILGHEFANINYETDEHYKDLKQVKNTYNAINMIGGSIASNLSQAVIYGRDLGDAVVDSLKAIAAELAAKAATYAILNMFAPGATRTVSLASFFGFKEGGMIPQYADGGSVMGGSGYKDDVPVLAQGGEYIINKKAVSQIGVDNLDAMNEGRVPRESVVVNINGDFIGTPEMANKLARIIKQQSNAGFNDIMVKN